MELYAFMMGEDELLAVSGLEAATTRHASLIVSSYSEAAGRTTVETPAAMNAYTQNTLGYFHHRGRGLVCSRSILSEWAETLCAEGGSSTESASHLFL